MGRQRGAQDARASGSHQLAADSGQTHALLLRRWDGRRRRAATGRTRRRRRPSTADASQRRHRQPKSAVDTNYRNSIRRATTEGRGKKRKKKSIGQRSGCRFHTPIFLFLSLFFSSPLADWQQSRNVCNQVSSLLLLGRSSEIGFLIFEIRRRSSNDYDEFCSRHHSAVNHAQFLSINFICSAATNSGSRRRRRRK